MNIEKIKEFFKNDKFAMNAGISIDWVENGNCCCTMPITDLHMNAGGTVQGGAIFTLCDFAFAVGSNSLGHLTVSLMCSVNFLKVAKGKVLTAVATNVSSTKRTAVYDVVVKDELGTLVSKMTITGFTKDAELTF